MADEDTKKEEGKKAKKDAAQPLPYLLDLSLTLWQLIVIVGGAAAAFLSWMNGAGLAVIALRTGATIISLGTIAILINRTLHKGMLDAYHNTGQNQENRW